MVWVTTFWVIVGPKSYLPEDIFVFEIDSFVQNNIKPKKFDWLTAQVAGAEQNKFVYP